MLNPIAPFRAALRARNLRLLLGGLATSQAGDWLYNLALLAYVYERTHSSTWVGISTAVRIVPEVALGSLAGVLVDRIDRRTLMLGADVARAVAMAALTLVAAVQAPIVFAPMLAALSTAAGSAYPQCVVAVLPNLTTEDQLPAANAARVSITYVCVVAGPLFGAVLLLFGSPAIAFAVNAFTFLLGALVVAALPRTALQAPRRASHEAPARLRTELADGWSALRSGDGMVAVAGANIIASAVYGALTVLLVLIAARLGLGAAGYGYLLAASGAGAVLATGIANRAAGAGRSRRVIGAAVLAVGAPLPLLGVGAPLAAVIALVAVFGAGSVVTEVVGDTHLQRGLDPAVFGRAYGLLVPACVAGIVIGALLAPLAVAVFGLSGTLFIVGIGVVAYGARLCNQAAASSTEPAFG